MALLDLPSELLAEVLARSDSFGMLARAARSCRALNVAARDRSVQERVLQAVTGASLTPAERELPDDAFRARIAWITAMSHFDGMLPNNPTSNVGLRLRAVTDQTPGADQGMSPAACGRLAVAARTFSDDDCLDGAEWRASADGRWRVVWFVPVFHGNVEGEVLIFPVTPDMIDAGLCRETGVDPDELARRVLRFSVVGVLGLVHGRYVLLNCSAVGVDPIVPASLPIRYPVRELLIDSPFTSRPFKPATSPVVPTPRTVMSPKPVHIEMEPRYTDVARYLPLPMHGTPPPSWAQRPALCGPVGSESTELVDPVDVEGDDGDGDGDGDTPFGFVRFDLASSLAVYTPSV